MATAGCGGLRGRGKFVEGGGDGYGEVGDGRRRRRRRRRRRYQRE